MDKIFVINDTHLGVRRQAGTTPESRIALTEYTLARFQALIDQAVAQECNVLLIAGDLFDGYEVSYGVLLATYDMLRAAIGRGLSVVAMRGNHDIHTTRTEYGSFDALCHILSEEFSAGSSAEALPFLWVREPQRFGPLWLIPHATNQEIFDTWLDDVIDAPETGLVLHANYDNGFAVESDHSLNVSAERMEQLHRAGVRRTFFAHVHQQATGPHGVVIIGNQFPTSVSDCLGNASKRALILTAGEATLGVASVETWNSEGEFFRCDWTQTDKVPAGVRFIRIEGEASNDQAEAVVDAIDMLRRRHKALVITNSVKIGSTLMDESGLGEEITNYSVLDFVFEHLTAEQITFCQRLLEQRECA